MTEEEKEAKAEAFNEKAEKSSSDYMTNMRELQSLCTRLGQLMNYFDPPEIMVFYGATDWDVFIRRKGSEAQFKQEEYGDGKRDKDNA